MKTGTALVTALLALTSFPLLAQQPSQQPSPASSPANPTAQQNPPETTAPSQPAATAASPTASPASSATAVMSPVNGELESKLDSKTAKTGDNIVVKTKASVKTADGTEIPKGSKLMGHIVAVKPSGAGENSQVALQIDHVELKGGQSLAVHSQIQSIAPPVSAALDNGSAAAMPGAVSPGGAPSGLAANGPRTSANPASSSTPAVGAPQGAGGAAGGVPAGSNIPAAGTVVATNGNIAIRTTSIPGVLLANNETGQQDPRMAQASSILLGAKKDIQLEGGTQMVIALAATGGGPQ